MNLTRFHGVFAPNFKYRKLVVPKVKKEPEVKGHSCASGSETLAKTSSRMSWAQRLKRVFQIDIEKCPSCGEQMKIIACVEDPRVITKILDHLGLESQAPKPLPARGPPRSQKRVEAVLDDVFEAQDFPEH